MMNTAPKQFAVIGHPVNHSLSPHIHLLFAGQFNIPLNYDRLDIEREELLSQLEQFKSKRFSGLNVTLPLKHDAYLLCQTLSDKAKLSESVNTISIRNNQLFGDTTDGIGLIRDLTSKGVKLENTRSLLVGAGGAANAVMADLIEGRPSTLYLTNRTIEKSMLMESHWRNFARTHSVTLKVADINDKDQGQYDVIINATSAGFTSELSPIPGELISHNTVCYDMIYGRETPFIKQAIEHNATWHDGLGMLIEQAAESFRIWHEVKPDTSEVLNDLRALKLI